MRMMSELAPEDFRIECINLSEPAPPTIDASSASFLSAEGPVGVRVTHIPTGVFADATGERQASVRDEALRRLRKKLAEGR
jgi:hypothetical protein